MKKIKGYTLTEIVTSLTISSIVLITGLSVYYIISNQSANYHQIINRKIQLIQLASGLHENFTKCKIVVANSDSSFIMFKESNKKYSFFNDCIVYSDSANNDTIKIALSKIQFILDGVPTKKGMINKLTINFFDGEKERSLTFSKVYDACSYLEYNNY